MQDTKPMPLSAETPPLQAPVSLPESPAAIIAEDAANADKSGLKWWPSQAHGTLRSHNRVDEFEAARARYQETPNRNNLRRMFGAYRKALGVAGSPAALVKTA